MQQKTCSKCKEIKPITKFFKEAKGLYGVRGDCATCKYKVKEDWAKQNPEKKKEQKKKRYIKKIYKKHVKN